MQTCKTNNCSVDSAAKSASANTCNYCYLHTKSVVLHVATYIHEMSKVVVVVVVVVVVKLLRWSSVVLNASSNALDEPV